MSRIREAIVRTDIALEVHKAQLMQVMERRTKSTEFLTNQSIQVLSETWYTTVPSSKTTYTRRCFWLFQGPPALKACKVRIVVKTATEVSNIIVKTERSKVADEIFEQRRRMNRNKNHLCKRQHQYIGTVQLEAKTYSGGSTVFTHFSVGTWS